MRRASPFATGTQPKCPGFRAQHGEFHRSAALDRNSGVQSDLQKIDLIFKKSKKRAKKISSKEVRAQQCRSKFQTNGGMNHLFALHSKKSAHIIPHHSFVQEDVAMHEIEQHLFGTFARRL